MQRLFALGLACSALAAGAARASMTPPMSSPFSLSFSSAAAAANATKPPLSLLVGVGCRSNKARTLSLAGAKCDCGEDAYFLAKLKDTTVVGVADGVGGYADLDCNPAELAWELMNHCEREAQKISEASNPVLPLDVMRQAYNRVLREEKVKLGGTTACVAALDHKTHLLRTANLGDSGCVVFRDSKPIFKTEAMEHAFNTPFQLSVQVGTKYRVISDHPDVSSVSETSVIEGDVVLLASDGLFDNMSDDQINATVGPQIMEAKQAISRTDHGKAEEILTIASKALVEMAFHLARYPERKGRSNFSRFAGKPDDTTVILAVVVPEVKPIKSNL